MADCNKTIDFFAERERMCEAFTGHCINCPLGAMNNGKNMLCDVFCHAETSAAVEIVQKWADSNPDPNADDKELLKAIDVVVEAQAASPLLIQRKLGCGYVRSAEIIDELEKRKIIGLFEGSKPRKVLIKKQQWEKEKGKQIE